MQEQFNGDAPPKALLKQSAFRRFWCARALTSSSFQMLSVAIGWQMYAMTHSAFALGMVGFCQFLPMFLLTFVVGHVADRYDRRVVAAICQALEGVGAGIVFVASLAGWLTPTGLFLLAGFVGAVRAFESPSLSALLPRLVVREQLPRATAFSASANQAAQILGPALGGALYLAGAPIVYAVCCICFIGASISVKGIDTYHAAAGAAKPKFTLASLFGGMSFIGREKVILGALSLDLFAVLFGGATALLPVYAHDVLHAGPIGLGALRSAPAVGALLGTLWLARFPLRDRPGRTMLLGIGVFGIATVVFGVSQSFVLSLVALFVLGLADTISVVVRSALVQLRTPDEMLGRVSAVNSLFIGTSNQLGEFESGVAAAWLGTKAAVISGGIATMLVAVLWVKLFPALYRTGSLYDRPAQKPE
jgi:MFS family permease